MEVIRAQHQPLGPRPHKSGKKDWAQKRASSGGWNTLLERLKKGLLGYQIQAVFDQWGGVH
jgi:hypothetical protein